jgi:tetratricopeptide (TPR) repeat protein
MAPHRACSCLVLLFLGCQSLPAPPVEARAADPDRPRTYLSSAAACLENSDEAGARPYLARYVAARPDDLMVRAYYAELLARLHETQAARAEFERLDAEGQDRLPRKQLIHCHTRLATLAATEEDDYAEHLHRGIGLYLLGQARAALPDPEGELSVEGLLCRAAAELTKARERRPEEARPRWYLHEVWARLGQHQPATRWLYAADSAAPFSDLTPVEIRDLRIASQN